MPPLAGSLFARVGSIVIDVVDNASVDGTVEMVRSQFPDVGLRALERNSGFSYANNLEWDAFYRTHHAGRAAWLDALVYLDIGGKLAASWSARRAQVFVTQTVIDLCAAACFAGERLAAPSVPTSSAWRGPAEHG